MKVILLFAAVVAGLLAQSPVPPAPDTLPQAWSGAGGAFNHAARPQGSAWFSYAELISASGQIYWFTTADFTGTRGDRFNLKSSIRPGLAIVFRRFGPITILAIADAGVVSAGPRAGSAFSGGGHAIWRLGKTRWTIGGGPRILHTAISSTEHLVEFGFGRIL
jgi:hypothetical protein